VGWGTVWACDLVCGHCRARSAPSRRSKNSARAQGLHAPSSQAASGSLTFAERGTLEVVMDTPQPRSSLVMRSPLLCCRVLAAGVLAVACSPVPSGERDAGLPSDLRTCVPAAGTTGSPATIPDALALLNGLPKPTTLPCFVESLDRPLAMYATQGVISAQPAQGRRSPRIFLFSGALILSVVPAGPGARLLEFGHLGDDKRSLKGEVEFPIQTVLSPEAPFSHILYDQGRTTCSFCHADEKSAITVGSAQGYTSVALRPDRSERVGVDEVRVAQQTCDAALEPDRCALFDALFSHGEVKQHEFPSDLASLTGP
jgi:hypothetical protein